MADTVKSYPDLSAAALRQKLDLPYRLWLLLRPLHGGRGWVTLGDAYNTSCGSRRQTRTWVRAGEGTFWTRAGERLFLKGLAKISTALETKPRMEPVFLRAERIESLQLFRAELFASFFADKPRIISQARLGEIFGRSAKTLYAWARLADLDIEHNLAWSCIPKENELAHYPPGVMGALGVKDAEEEAGSVSNIWAEHWRGYPRKGWTYQRGDVQVLCFVLPNRYESDLTTGKRTTLQRQAIKRAPDYAAGANAKLFYKGSEAKKVARALQSGQSVFIEEEVEHWGRRLWEFMPSP